MTPRATTVELTPAPQSAGLARRFVQDQVRAWRVDTDENDVALMVSELVTNVSLHARTEALVRVSWRGDPRMPALAEIRDAVAREWTRARTVEVRKQFYEALRGRYSVRIEPLAPDDRPGGR